MRLAANISFCCVVGLLVVPSVAAQKRMLPEKHSGEAASQAETLTGKERLGPKWTDEQRIDNCNVPVEKRGTRPRPVKCPNQLTN